ncbi:hypothetical protein [uncultured Sulfitobacter sp.]|uniref:hypothetical protein n=1 Tax=uncultured Sulfitobacter sp. TaxID=191468 RepID=UPI002606FEEA|nr:hypothetical protein [uncultured Sulfitobacter sp.]
MAEEKLNLNIVSYQPPVGLIEYINKHAPKGVEYNQRGYVGLADADLLIYYMSSFERRFEITEFGSKVLDAGDEISKGTFVVTRSIKHRDRIVYALYVATEGLNGSEEYIKCNTANAVSALSLNFKQDFQLDILKC